MVNTNPNEPLQFGRVVYVEPNNNIVGTGQGTNFTFNPEDYSILVDLQVDVVDRFAYNGSGTKEEIQYTLEWDAKGTKTSMFKGTNGLLTTKALNTSFTDITENLNQEAIGINSIDIRYNSWNYPEVTINFTDIRGASLLASADFIHSDVLPDEKKRIFTDNFANTFFSTFFRFPYPRYTLIVKGFYGRPVTYTLCVNDFKTRFNTSTGNFDVTVSFIGYMYGLLTDIPIRLLFAAPYCEYKGAEHWKQNVENGTFTYTEGTRMITFFDLNQKLKKINENLEKMSEMMEIIEETKAFEDRKNALQEVNNAYYSYRGVFDGSSTDAKRRLRELDLSMTIGGTENRGRKYLVLFSDVSNARKTCQMCGGTGKVLAGQAGFAKTHTQCPDCHGHGLVERKDTELDGVDIEGTVDKKIEFYSKVRDFNARQDTSGTKISYIPRISTENEAKDVLKGTIAYRKAKNNEKLGFVGNKLKYGDSAFANVVEEDFEKVIEFLKGDAVEMVNNMTKSSAVAVTLLRVDEFERSVDELIASIDSELDLEARKAESVQEKVYSDLLGFKVSLRNIIYMCLAHLDTFMTCMYDCMDDIKGRHRLFSQARLSKNESDVQSTTEGESRVGGSPLYLPPFFAFRKVNPKTSEYEDEWIGSDSRFSDRDTFVELKMVDGLLNGALKAEEEAKKVAEAMIASKVENNPSGDIGKDYIPTFVNDYVMGRNPYSGSYDSIEKLVAMFAFRMMLGSVYSSDFPNIANRFDAGNDGKKKAYMRQLALNDAENFAKDADEFGKFRDSALKDAFSELTWDDFEAYVTGKAKDGGIMQQNDGHIFKSGDMNSPLFTKYGSDDYVLSYGHVGNGGGKYVLPLNFSSAEDAVSISNSVYRNSETAGNAPETNGIGIKRECGFPIVDVVGNDDEFKKNRGKIAGSYENICKDGDTSDIGWYFKTENNWREYFSGVVRGETEHWFPTIIRKNEDLKIVQDALDVNDKKNTRGNVYEGQVVDGEQIYSYLPDSGLTSMRDFFISKEESWWKRLWGANKNEENGVRSGASDDRYVETKVVPLVVNSPDEVTLMGLPCAEGTLFESEFYLMQNNGFVSGAVNRINSNLSTGYNEEQLRMFRKAFLFLHSLPTSEYGALSRVVETLIKSTYTPSMTDIPLSSALFIGALYWREIANGGRDNVDDFLYYSGSTVYKVAKAGQLLTYSKSDSRLNGEKIRRPLHPIKSIEKSLSYLDVISKSDEDEFRESEADFYTRRKDDRLRRMIEANKNDVMRYVGFWNVTGSVKWKFIDLFTNWVLNGFPEIEKELSLRDSGGTEYTIEKVQWMKDVIEKKVFEKGKANDNFKGGIKKGDSYNEFVKNSFNANFFKNHMRFGASKTDESLFAFLRINSEILQKVNSLVTSGCIVKIPFPRILMTRDMFSPDFDVERTSLRMDDDVLKEGWNTFRNAILEKANKEDEDEEREGEILDNVLPASVSDAAKLSLYETLKNVHDKWLVATKREKYMFSKERRQEMGGYANIADNFFFINSFYEDVGDEITLNVEELPKQIDMVIENSNSPNSLYSFMYDVSNQARVQLLALPVFNNLSDPKYLREMFTPIPYDKLDMTKIYTETQYVFLYPEEASKQVSIPGDARSEEDRYKFADDSFTLVTESGVQNIKDIPNTFSNSSGRHVPVFGVTFAKQNQSFFKSVNVSMDSPKTTEVSVHNTFAIANKFNGGNTQVTALGQDLFPIYSNYSYECTVEMMGCACIMPLMYFQLNNIPMFKGTYIVYNVSHSITPGNMTTTFSGQRLSRYRKKRNEDSLAAAPNDIATRTMNSLAERSYDSIIDDCYTPSGHKLENEYVYNNISKESGVSDKAALRAVEYAETHYTGGFFNNGRVKAYYDPYIAYNKNVTGDGLTVSDQFDANYVVPDTYEGNSEKVAMAADSLDREMYTDEERFSIASSCTIVGAFGIPADSYEKCGAESVKEFIETSNKSFSAQGNYFAALLKNYDELRNALQNKDWDKFAGLYKGQGGVSSTGVFMRDDPGFKKYAKDLEAGYNDVKNASSDNYEKYEEQNPSKGDVPSVVDPNSPQVDVEKVVRALKRNVTRLLRAQNGKEVVDRGGYVDKNGNVISEKGSGTKLDKSVSRCSTYVKLALVDGGIAYVTCDASDCKDEAFIKNYCYKIYDSKPGDYGTAGNGMNKSLERGDIVIIDKGGEHKYGHIAIWTGDSWISDFTQPNCDIYRRYSGASNGKNMWDAGKFHFYRFKNRINV